MIPKVEGGKKIDPKNDRIECNSIFGCFLLTSLLKGRQINQTCRRRWIEVTIFMSNVDLLRSFDGFSHSGPTGIQIDNLATIVTKLLLLGCG